jgi:Ca2+-binding RTX toxin-like protein
LLVDLDGLGFDIIVSGSDGDGVPAEADDLVNTSTQGWAVKGSSGQTNEFNESIKFSFVDDGTLDPNANQYGVKDFKFTTQGYTGGLAVASVLVTIQFVDASDGNAVKTDTIALELTSGQQVRVTDLDWGAGVNDYTAGDDIYSVTILSQEELGSYRLNGIEVGNESITPPADLSYDFTLPINDSDGDTDSQSFNLSIAGETADGLTVEAITGTSGDDILVGTTGDDILIGGLGDDTMTGDTGADTFVINTVHLGTPDDVAADIITDFNEGEGDVLDLSDVLASGNTIEGVDNGGHLQIQVLDAEANVVQTIDLNTVNITTNATDALNALLGSGAVDDGV